MKRIRILHTADLHLDSCFASLGAGSDLGNQLRNAQKTVLTRIVAHAQRWPADAVIIAGDLFDNERVELSTVEFVIGLLEQLSPIQVYIAPGNRDPYTPDSPYALELWPDNVTVFSPGAWEPVPHAVLPLTVHGYACEGKDDSGDWFKTLALPDDGRIHLAVAHGTARGYLPPHGKNFAPFDVSDIARERLAYLALGHFHSMTEIEHGSGTVIRYPGAPQGRNFDEVGQKYFLEVEITYDAPEEPGVAVAPVPVAEILFDEIKMDAARLAPGPAAWEACTGADVPPKIMRICLEGEGTRERMEAAEILVNDAKRFFLHVESVDNTRHIPESLPVTGSNSCLVKLVEAMEQKIMDEPVHETALLEADSLDLAINACLGADLTLPDTVTNS